LNDLQSTKLSRGSMIWWFGSSPSPSPVSKLDRRHKGPRKTEKERQLAEGRRWVAGGGRGAESHDCKKAWSSINHSILSGDSCRKVGRRGGDRLHLHHRIFERSKLYISSLPTEQGSLYLTVFTSQSAAFGYTDYPTVNPNY
jgi:hypothetical protein